ncbi:helix-turn-helix transcriptional regulator [Serratia fonticola]|uniref:helix-turn-helix transcriptional regulator n=1 Tax=Serratia fonticola TaxID=47917 RepID=UPI002DBF74A4|nr:LuxR C-terminal-related transcriptional regulator [Serratia fonticola]MEB7886691.1 LuxR C-terminal-related transcriptional regulator [Serratia fonticola]
MIIIDSDYPCAYSKITFKNIIDSLSVDSGTCFPDHDSTVIFVDGNTTDAHNIIKSVYEMRKSGKMVYMVTLLSMKRDCSSVLRHLSDIVVDKNITYDALKRLMVSMVAAEPKVLADNVFGDIWGDILKSSQKEYRVLKLLLEGYSQYQISQMLNLSIKTISGYKIRAVKRHGARNFNELYLSKLHMLHNELKTH